ncbi:LLM class flavin-dependent oxidoreductase [Candidatus Poriferisodalis sp.]|uniref:LLM class flavin-dependent oxidoreductase n=1 Tax=Candidatus Poriferisodalis sp. TaxID=3101277 RepID=UPI003B029FA1
MNTAPPEIAWFSALCDDDYEFLGVPDPTLASTWEHCADIVTTAERNGFDNVLLPSGYSLGIDATAFAAGIATRTSRINLLLAVRMGELWPPQLARQLATVDQMAGGRLTINIISSDLPGAPLPSAPRYQRTREHMEVLRTLLNGQPVDFDGEFVSVQLDPPRVGTVSGRCPPFYFGGFSDDAKHTAALAADVFLTWPDTIAGVAETVTEMRDRATAAGRELKFGLRAHMIVRPTTAEAMDATRRLVSQLDDDTGATIRARALDSASVGVQRQAQLRDSADDDGFAEEGLWTGIGRARSGAGAAIVGSPEEVSSKLGAYQEAGIDAFILSGYPHLAECDLFGRLVLQTMPHRKLWNP